MKSLGSQIPTVLRDKLDRSITLSLKSPQYSLIWLHGLGDSSEGFFEYFMHPKSPVYSGARVRLLQAPLRPVTINGGALFNSWYDIKSLSRLTGKEEDNYNIDEIKQSSGILNNEIENEVQFWKKEQSTSPMYPYHRVYVGGFSQGCAISLYYALQSSRPVAGVVGFSGYLFKSTKLTNLGKLNIMLKHGASDSMIPEALAKQSYKPLLREGNRVQYESIPSMDHTVDLQELADMTEWLGKSHRELQKFYRVNPKQ